MLLDIGAERVSDIPLNPLPTMPTNNTERAAVEWENQRLTYGTGSGARSLHEAYERARERARQAGAGADELPNPVDYDATAMGGIFRATGARSQIEQDYAATVEQLRQRYPDRAADFLTPEEIQQEADKAALGARRRADDLEKVGGGGLGALAAQIGAAVIDPVNVLTMPLGAGRIGGGLARQILLGALAEGAVGAGSQIAADLNPFGQGGAWERQRLGLPMDVGANALEAFTGGAVLGGGMRGLVEGFKWYRGRAPARDAGNALREADAEQLLERTSQDLASNPAGPAAAETHLDLLDRATEAAAAGRIASDEVRAPAPNPRHIDFDFLGGGPPASTEPPRVQLGEADGWLNQNVQVSRDQADRAGLTGEIESHFAEGLTAAQVRQRIEDRLGFLPVEERPGFVVQVRASLGIPSQGTAEGKAEFAAWRAGYDARRKPRASIAGAQIRIHTPAGRSIAAEPQIVELRDLIPSHTDDLAQNPAYPHAEGVQPRDRSRDASIAQIREIAANLEPDRLKTSPEAGNGAPIIDGENVVESGNGRVLALRQAYNDPALASQATAYRAMLEAQGHDVSSFQQPVLVSRRVTALAPEERRSFVREANSSAALSLGAAERARLDADIAGRALDLYQGGDITAAANMPFVRGFVQGIPQAERGAMMAADGTLSGEGARRIRGAVLARAYGDEMGPLLDRILEGEAEGLRSIAGALQDSSGKWAAMRQAAGRGELAPGVDVTADLLAAVRTVSTSREKRIPVADLLAQTDLDAPPLTDNARALLASMYQEPGFKRAAGREAIAARLNGYVDEAMQTKPEPDLFGAPPPSSTDIMQATDPTRGRQKVLVEAAEQIQATRAAAPKADDADFLEAQRIAVARDLPIPVDEAGTTKGLRELLDEAETAAADAAGAAACLIGGASAGSLI